MQLWIFIVFGGSFGFLLRQKILRKRPPKMHREDTKGCFQVQFSVSPVPVHMYHLTVLIHGFYDELLSLNVFLLWFYCLFPPSPLQVWATLFPAFLSTVPTTSSASVNLASRKCVGTSSSSSKTWRTSPCHARLTWTLQGERRAPRCVCYYFDVHMYRGSSFQKLHRSCVQLDRYQVKRIKALLVIFTFPVVEQRSEQHGSLELSMSSKRWSHQSAALGASSWSGSPKTKTQARKNF